MDKIKEKLEQIKIGCTLYYDCAYWSLSDKEKAIERIENLTKDALAMISEMEKEDKFTVRVTIPEPIIIDEYVFCSHLCDFKPPGERCVKRWNKPFTDHISPQCPQYKGEPIK